MIASPGEGGPLETGDPIEDTGLVSPGPFRASNGGEADEGEEPLPVWSEIGSRTEGEVMGLLPGVQRGKGRKADKDELGAPGD